MRVLMRVPPDAARLHELVPLAWALRTAGHAVQVAGPPSYTETISLTGLVSVAASSDEELADHAELWRPDLVIWDGSRPPARLGDAATARVLGMVTPDGRDGAGAADLTLDCLPPSLREPGDAGHRSVRFIPHTGPAVIPAWLRRMPRRQRVHLTAGPAGIGAALAGVGDVPAEVICAADQVPADANLPDNVRLVDDVPLTAVLATCSAVLHDGAAVPVAAAMAAGLPQLGLITGPADPWLFRRVVRQGAGAVVDPGSVGEHLTRVLIDAAPREHAERLRDELAAMPNPHAVVADLTELAHHL